MVKEGAQPAENPAELIAELEAVARELGLLIKRINRTNSVTLFEGERTVSDVLAERDVLAMRRNLYAGLAEAATVQRNRYMRTEVKYVSTLNVAENRKRADALAREYRELERFAIECQGGSPTNFSLSCAVGCWQTEVCRTRNR